MDFNIEVDFVMKYVKKEYRDRLLFELQSKKHREKAISRFCHSSQQILIDCFTKCTMSDFQKLFCLETNSMDKCYLITNDVNDGKLLLLREAIEYCQKSYMAVILICSKFVVIREEFERAEPLLLISNT